jgi:hypothetical protein
MGLVQAPLEGVMRPARPHHRARGVHFTFVSEGRLSTCLPGRARGVAPPVMPPAWSAKDPVILSLASILKTSTESCLRSAMFKNMQAFTFANACVSEERSPTVLQPLPSAGYHTVSPNHGTFRKQCFADVCILGVATLLFDRQRPNLQDALLGRTAGPMSSC